MFKNLRPLVPYLRKYRATFYIGALCVLCNNVVWILFPMVIRDAVRDLNTQHHRPDPSQIRSLLAGRRR